jgi:hypothetical protein
VVSEEGGVEIDPRFRAEFEQVLANNDLLDLDGLMSYHGHFDELPLFAVSADVSFLNGLSYDERNRTLMRTAVAYLETILEHSRRYYEGREYDYFCAVTVTDWELFDEGALVKPRFLYANPSHGAFAVAPYGPPTSKYSQMIAEWLDHSPDYVINETVVHVPFGSRVERTWVQHTAAGKGEPS